VPHIARNTGNGRRSAVPRAVASTRSYGISRKVRKRIEQGFGWIKTIGGLRKLPIVGLAAVRGWVTWTFGGMAEIRAKTLTLPWGAIGERYSCT
jgi:hypothetical protein